MNISVRKSSVVRPAEETPNPVLWTSNVDQLFKFLIPSVYFYKSNGSCNFFDADVLKSALSDALVSFYPIAGRLQKDQNGRFEINCNGAGVLFLEAETETCLDDLGDFAPREEFKKLIPKVDNTSDITAYPLLVLQVTYFKCGGVCLGVGMEHTVADGASGTHFINSWSEIARGLDITMPPFIDRTLLRSRDPPTPSFPHFEHHPPPTIRSSLHSLEPESSPRPPSVAIYKLTTHQVNLLKAKCKDGPDRVGFSSFAAIGAHVWRCASKARGLQFDQESKVSIIIDGRARLQPPLPAGYLGNAVFHVTPMAVSGDILTKPLSYTAKKIQDPLVQANDKYLKSAIDFLELQSDKHALKRGPQTFMSPNLGLTSWVRMPIHDADFGWGRPIFMGPGTILYEGLVYILPSPTKDGTLSVAVSMQPGHMGLFKKFFYDI